MECLMSFGIQGPKGDTGARGPQGAQGPQGPAATSGITSIGQLWCNRDDQTLYNVKFAINLQNNQASPYPDILLKRGVTWYYPGNVSYPSWSTTMPSDTSKYGMISLSSSGTLSWRRFGSNMDASYQVFLTFM